MNKQDLYELIASGEDSFTEFKRDVSQRSDFASEMIALANSAGGQILVGVDDAGVILGVDDPKRVEEAIVNIGRQNCTPALIPTIDHVLTDEGLVLVIGIPRRFGVPHENNSGQCYLRVGSSKRLATSQERARMLQAAGWVHFDETPVPNTRLADLDLNVFGEYYRRVYESSLAANEIPLDRMMANMRFLVPEIDGRLNASVAGLLLFGKAPQEAMYYARVSAVRWAGVEAGEVILDRQEIVGRLAQQIEQTEAFVLRNTRLSTIIEGVQQRDVSEYPRPAIREAIVNAIAHRDYSLDGAQILLYIFDNRLEIRSPGVLPNSVTLDNIRTHYSKPRNETIARVLFNLGYVNTLGSGIPRIIRLIREHTGQTPEFSVTDSQFVVRLPALSHHHVVS